MAILIVSAPLVAWAHHPNVGREPPHGPVCVDARSVTVSIARPGGKAGQGAALRRDLTREVPAVLDAFEGPAPREGPCTGARAYLRLDLRARYLDPHTYLNFPGSTYDVRASLQVGPYTRVRDGTSERFASDLFALVRSELHSEEVTGTAVTDRLRREGRSAVLALAAARAESTTPHPALASMVTAPTRRWAIGAPLTLAVLASAIVVWWTRRRRPPHEPSPSGERDHR